MSKAHLPIKAYWSMPIDQAVTNLDSSDTGLISVEAQKRLLQNGPNKLIVKSQDSLILAFLKQFLNPLILLLLFASAVSAFTGAITECLIIVIIIVISTALDFLQQYRAEQATKKLQERVSLTTNVYRDGKLQAIPATNLVVGDVIAITPGNLVPADVRLLTSNELLVDESTLTGESNPVEKDVNASVTPTATIGQRVTSLFMATHVISGSGTAIVVKTGNATEYGQIAKSLSQKQPEHAFEAGLKRFGYLIMRFTLVLVIVVFFINAFRHQEIVNSFVFALALAVGLTPELLPIIVTLNLSRGALRMAKKGVIVKHLPAIQDFGSMEILCTDKTGTLTENHIELERYEDVTERESESVFHYGYVNSHFVSSLKTPLEKAVLAHEHLAIKDFKKVDEIPFDFERRASSVIVKQANKTLLITKGATDRIVGLSTSFELNGTSRKLTPEKRKEIIKRFEELSQKGFRVLALAKKDIVVKPQYSVKDESSFTFLGLMAFFDPPKKTAEEALRILHERGVQIKILTGDNELVTQKICEELNLPVTGVLRGDKIDGFSDATLEKLAMHTTIFARISPEQKQRIIVILKRSGAVVGYLGDGINDAPSLKAADIGISVNNAVDIAKESASLILLHNDLHVLKDGVVEGRKTYANIMKYIMMGASSNFGNMFSMAGASFFLPFLPMLPVQILLNNLLYDISELAIPTDNVDLESIAKPRKWDVSFIKRFMLVFGPISSLFDFLTFFLLLHVLMVGQTSFQTGWFIESLVSQSIIILVIRTSRFPFFKSLPSTTMLASTILLILIALALPFLPFAQLFSFTPMPIAFYYYLLAILASYIIVVEFVKRWFYTKLTV